MKTTKHKNRHRRERVERSRSYRLPLASLQNSGGCENQIPHSTRHVGLKVRREIDLVVTGNVAFEKSLEERRVKTLRENVLEGVEHELMSTKSELAMTTCLFIEGTRHSLLELTILERNVSSLVTEVVEMDHELEIFGHLRK